MSQELGKIEKPTTEEFKSSRKLFYVPLIFSPREPQVELLDKVTRYWQQVEEHLANLEAKLGNARIIFHELVPVGGEIALKTIQELSEDSFQIIKSRVDNGAKLEPLEDRELLAEFMDWSRCLGLGLQSHKAFTVVYEAYTKAQEARNEFISKKINETIQKEDIAILLMREGHKIHFPEDIELFYIAPPGLDEIKRWVREQEAEFEKQMAEAAKNTEADTAEPEDGN